ncbi:MAG TPA: transcription elongation factor GreA [Acidimicrobiales bacterium]|jgi:transcription elongation factor GreA
MADAQELSPQAYARLAAELEELTGEGRIEIANKIEAARMLGDLSENGDYHAAKDQQGKMEARIRHLQGILVDATIVEGGGPSDVVGVGSIVEVRFAGDDETERYLVGSIEERHEEYEVVSPGSPLGSALLGAAPGESRRYDVKGNVLEVEVVSVSVS